MLGLAAQVNIVNVEAAFDRLTVNALNGDDTVDASGLPADAILLTEDGGNGDDLLIGGDGDDTLLGGNGDDAPDRRPGAGRSSTAGTATTTWSRIERDGAVDRVRARRGRPAGRRRFEPAVRSSRDPGGFGRPGPGLAPDATDRV